MHYLDFIPRSTLHETNSSHLEMDGWNTCFLLEWPYAVTSISSGLALCSPSAFSSSETPKNTRRWRDPPPWESGKAQCARDVDQKSNPKKKPLLGSSPVGLDFFVERCKNMSSNNCIAFQICIYKESQTLHGVPLTSLHIYIGHWLHVGQLRRCGLEQPRPDAQKDAIVAWGLGSPVLNGT